MITSGLYDKKHNWKTLVKNKTKENRKKENESKNGKRLSEFKVEQRIDRENRKNVEDRERTGEKRIKKNKGKVKDRFECTKET